MRLAAAFVAVAGLLAACGGSSGDSGAPSSTPSTPSTTTTTVTTTTAPTGVETVGSDGCGTEADPGPTVEGAGDVVQTIESGGKQRSWRLGVPAGYDADTPAPLIFNFHGLGSNAAEQSVYSRLPRLGGDRGAIVVTPDSIGGTWSVGADGPDVRFVDDLVDEVEGRYCVDTRRVFAAGMSLGAGMSAVVACARPGTFGAIGLVTVEIKPPTCEPVPVIGFHGTADPVVAFDPPGGRKTTPQNVAEWVALDGCDIEPVSAPVGADVTHDRYGGCDEGTEVQFFTVKNGGHSWPGADIQVPWGRTTQTVDATDLILDFFEAHPLRG